jgi:hypothetical protein
MYKEPIKNGQSDNKDFLKSEKVVETIFVDYFYCESYNIDGKEVIHHGKSYHHWR